MNKNIKFFIIPALIAVLSFVTIPANAQVVNGDDDSSSVTPAVSNPRTGSVSNGADDVSNPSTDTSGSVSNGNDDSAGSTGEVRNGDDDTSNPTTDTGGTTNTGGEVRNGDDDTSAPNNPSTPTTPTEPTKTGSRRSGGGSRISTANLPVVTPVLTVTTSGTCPLLKDYMRADFNNNPSEVAKLQAFFKNTEKMDVDINGIFDAKTEQAVNAFQVKYMSHVLGPWKATQPSGMVYITTLKKINQIACNIPLTLSQAELDIINAFTAKKLEANQTEQNEMIFGNKVSTTTSLVLKSDVDNENDNVATAGRASFIVRFWNFVLGIFR